MPWIDLPNGGHAHICIRHKRTKRCQFCNTGYEEKLCDFPVNPKGKTCDASICAKCATSVGPDQDYCPKHKGMTAAQGTLAL